MSQSPEGSNSFVRDFLSFKKVKKGFLTSKSYWKTYYFILEPKSKKLTWYKGRDRSECRGSLTFTKNHRIAVSKTEQGVILIYDGESAKSAKASSSFEECIELGCNSEELKRKWLKALIKSLKNIDVDQQHEDINLLLDLLPEEMLAQEDPPLPSNDFPSNKFNLNPQINSDNIHDRREESLPFDSSKGSDIDDDNDKTSTDIFKKKIQTNNKNINDNTFSPPSLATIAEDDTSETDLESPIYENYNNNKNNTVKFDINQPIPEAASTGFVERDFMNSNRINDGKNNGSVFTLGNSVSESLTRSNSNVVKPNGKNLPKLERSTGGVRMEFNGCIVTTEALNKMKDSLEVAALLERKRLQSDKMQIFRTPQNERHRGSGASMSLTSAPHPATRLRRRQYISDASQDYKSLDTASTVTEFTERLKQHLAHLKEVDENDGDPVIEALIECHIEPGCDWASLIAAIHFLEDTYIKSAERLRADGWCITGDDQPANKLFTCALAFATGKELHFDFERKMSLHGVIDSARRKAGEIGVGADFLESAFKAEWESLRNPLLELTQEYSAAIQAAESLLLHQEFRYAQDNVRMKDVLDKQKNNYNALRREYDEATRSLKRSGGRIGGKDSKEKQMEISRLLEEKQEMTKRFNEEREKLIKENRQIRMALHPDNQTAAASIKSLERRVEEAEKRLLESNRRLVVLGGIPVTEDWEVEDKMTRTTAANASLAGASNTNSIKGLTMAHLEGEHVVSESKDNSLFSPQRWMQHFHASKAGDDTNSTLHGSNALGSSTQSTTNATVASSNNNTNMNGRKMKTNIDTVLQAPPSYARTREIEGSDSLAGDKEFLQSKGQGTARTRKMFDFDQRMQRKTVSHLTDLGPNKFTHNRTLNPPMPGEKLDAHYVNNNNNHYASNIENSTYSQLSRTGGIDPSNDTSYSALHADEHNLESSYEQRMRRILNLGGSAYHHSNYEMKMDDFRAHRHGGFASPTQASKRRGIDKPENKLEKGFKFSQYSLNDPLVGTTHHGGNNYVGDH